MNIQAEPGSTNIKFKKMVDCYPMTYVPCDTMLSNPKHHFFIKEISFFSSFDAAKAYDDDRLTVDFTSQASAERMLKLDGNTSTGLFGKYSFDDKEGAVSLEYSNSVGSQADYGSRVKLSIRMIRPGMFRDGQSYMVVTYRTNIKDSIALKLGNFRHKYIVLAPDISISNDKYVRTEPVNINVFDLPLENYFKRLNLFVENYPYTNNDLLCLVPLYDPGYHRHNHIEIMYNLSGFADVLIHGKKYAIKEGDAVIINPKLVHKVVCYENTATIYSIRFMPDVLYQLGNTLPQLRYRMAIWQKKMDENPYISSEELAKIGMDAIIRDIIESFSSKQYAYEIIVQSKINNIFALMLRKYCTAVAEDPGPDNAMISAFEKAISEAKSNLFEYNTKKAALDANMSYSYFCNNFKKAYSMSFAAYLESMRLHEAEHLLLTPEMSITDIAIATGFSSASHFIKKFKLAYGITPYTFRANVSADSKLKQ